jgi:hypothetical protein
MVSNVSSQLLYGALMRLPHICDGCGASAISSCVLCIKKQMLAKHYFSVEVQLMNGCSGVVLSKAKEWVLNLLLCPLIALLCSTP